MQMGASMKCPECGKEIRDGMLFCSHCGGEIRIVQDYVPEVDEIVAGMEVAVASELAETKTVDEDKGEQGQAAPSHRRLRRKRSSPLMRKIAACCALILIVAFVGILDFLNQNAAYQYKMAIEWMEKKDYDRARPYAEQAAELEPENADYLICFLTCLSETGFGEEAVPLCLRIIELNPSCQAAYKTLISIYEKEKEYGKINELLLSCKEEQIISQYPSYLAKPPEFSFKGGIYNETLSLKLLGNTKGTVYYTMDGSQPDESSLVYASPIFLESGNYQIRAIFVNDYGVASDEAKENYYVDVTVPEAPVVTPESGEYSRPTLLQVTAGENCTVYYTTDGSQPSKDSTEYTGPIPMPVGTSHFRFVSYSYAGAASEEISASYSLNLHASLSMEAARNMLLIDLMEAGVILDLNGGIRTGTGHNVYNYRYAITVNDTDYYLYREYYEDDAGNRASTGTDYAVSVMEGQCYKVVQVESGSRTAVAAEALADPWDGLSLQNIKSEENSEQ